MLRIFNMLLEGWLQLKVWKVGLHIGVGSPERYGAQQSQTIAAPNYCGHHFSGIVSRGVFLGDDRLGALARRWSDFSQTFKLQSF